MNMKTLRKLAKQHDLAPEKLDKIELIRGIQRGEGNFDCFAKAYDGYGDQSACRWRVAPHQDSGGRSVARGGSCRCNGRHRAPPDKKARRSD